MFYHNDSSDSLHPLALPSCEQYCPLQDFIRLTKGVITTDWEKECQVETPAKDTGLYFHLLYFGYYVEMQPILFCCFQHANADLN